MKWLAAFLLLASVPGWAADGWERKSQGRRPGRSELTPQDLSAISQRLAGQAVRAAQRPAARLSDAGEGWAVHIRPEQGTPGFISVPRSAARRAPARSTRAPSALALDVLQERAQLFGLQQPRDELRHMETVRDVGDLLRVRFSRRVEGVPVWGEDLVLHLDHGGQLVAFNGVYSASREAPLDEVTVTESEAIATAVDDLRQDHAIPGLPAALERLLEYDGPTAELMLRRDDIGDLHPVWRVAVRPNWRDHWIYAIDGLDGSVVERYNATPSDGPESTSAVGLSGLPQTLNTYAVADSFLMLDASRSIFAPAQPDLLNDPRGALVTLTAGNRDLTRGTQIRNIVSRDNTWDDPVAVSAHTNMGIVFDYFLQTHGRQSIDGVGGSLFSVIHVTDDGQPMDNAFWNGVFMAYGDGGQAFAPLAGGLDVAAHEMTHGVIQHTVNLEYRNQSGALNESFADVFGVMVDRDDWQMGEDVVRSRTIFGSGVLRDMENPNNGVPQGAPGWQPAHTAEFRDLPLSTDNGGVHINSGIPNRACFLLAEAIGRERTEQIYYRVLASRLINQRGNFIDMRNAAAQAARELFGEAEVAAVEEAFRAVGIVGGDGYQVPQRAPVVPGEELVLVVSEQGSDRGLYRLPPDATEVDELTRLTTTPVLDFGGNTVSVAANGSFVMFVDAGNNLRIINIDGTDEQVISSTREWQSISLSPDGKRLAATTVFQDATLVIFDLEQPDRSKVIELTRPTTQQGISTGDVQFADALDWDPGGEFLLYDALNVLERASGETLEFWDVNLLEPESELILPLFPPQAEGVTLGNPTIARNSARHVVFDRLDTLGNISVWVFDLVTGESGQIVRTRDIGFPKFSPDDSELIYETRDSAGRRLLSRISLSEDRLSPVGDERPFLTNAQIPNWFIVADDPPTSAETSTEATPAKHALRSIYPNPFNPATTISYELSAPGHTQITVYDIRGARVTTLVEAERSAGTHSVGWNGLDADGRRVASGVYLVRLQVRGPQTQFEQTRRITLLR